MFIMYKNRGLLLSFFVITLTLNSNQESFRIFTNANNQKIEARFKSFKGNLIEITRKDGLSFRVNPLSFSNEDQEYISDLKSKINPKTNRLWTENDFKSLILRNKWTCRIESGDYKHIFEFSLDKIDLDKDDIPDGRKVVHHTSWVNKRRQSNFGWWKVNAEGALETSIGNWVYDKKNNILTGACKSCNSSCCSSLRPFIMQIEQR